MFCDMQILTHDVILNQSSHGAAGRSLREHGTLPAWRRGRVHDMVVVPVRVACGVWCADECELQAGGTLPTMEETQ